MYSICISYATDDGGEDHDDAQPLTISKGRNKHVIAFVFYLS